MPAVGDHASDGDACTFAEECGPDGLRGSLARSCSLGPCEVGACSPTTGSCVVTALPDGAPCFDAEGDLCVLASQCVSGVCVPTETASCDDQNPATDDVCNTQTGECHFFPRIADLEPSFYVMSELSFSAGDHDAAGQAWALTFCSSAAAQEISTDQTTCPADPAACDAESCILADPTEYVVADGRELPSAAGGARRLDSGLIALNARQVFGEGSGVLAGTLAMWVGTDDLWGPEGLQHVTLFDMLSAEVVSPVRVLLEIAPDNEVLLPQTSGPCEPGPVITTRCPRDNRLVVVLRIESPQQLKTLRVPISDWGSGQWHHVAVTLNPNDAWRPHQLYVDGRPADVVTEPKSAPPPLPSRESLPSVRVEPWLQADSGSTASSTYRSRWRAGKSVPWYDSRCQKGQSWSLEGYSYSWPHSGMASGCCDCATRAPSRTTPVGLAAEGSGP